MRFLLSLVFVLTALPAFAEGMGELEDQGRKPAPSIESSNLRIDINRKGEIFIDGEIFTTSGLREFFEAREYNPNDKIVVFADEEIEQNIVLMVMDICCNYKYQKIKLFYKPSWIHKT